MIEITPEAQEKLLAHLTAHKLEPQVRIIHDTACDADGRLILAPEPIRPGDVSRRFGSLTLGLSQDIHELAGLVRVDFRYEGQDSGFIVETERQPPGPGCAGCTSCGC